MEREVLLYADTVKNSDMLYFAGVSIHDPFFAFSHKGKKCAMLTPLEIGRARRSSRLDEIFDEFKCGEHLRCQKFEGKYIAAALFRKLGIGKFLVDRNFPAIMLDFFRAQNFDLKVSEKSSLFPERSRKKVSEIKEIEAANAVASAGFAIVEDFLKKSKISSGILEWKGKPLSSEMLISEIEREAIRMGADAIDTIASSGDQACDPHEVGRGVISANSLIVVDIFPRLRRSGYFGDMTRTFLKGKPSSEQAKIVERVLEAQSLALSKICSGADGAEIHKSVSDFFESRGFATSCHAGKWRGFIHSTGHGLGLDVHEAPNLGRTSVKLESGNVVTVEPGLYYPGIGACRIEDNVAVRKSGYRLLSDYHYNWVIA